MSIITDLGSPAGKSALVATCAVSGVGTFLALAVWHVVGGGHPFDAMSYATAWGVTLATSTAAISGHAYVQAKAAQVGAAS